MLLNKDINSFNLGVPLKQGKEGLVWVVDRSKEFNLLVLSFNDADIYLLNDPFSVVNA